MMNHYIAWKTYLVLGALAIVTASLYFTNQLARRLGAEEKKKVEQLAFSLKTLAMATNEDEVTFAQTFVAQNNSIPLIITDENFSIIDTRNIDTSGVADPNDFLTRKLSEFREMHHPIIANYGAGHSFIFYGDSYLLKQLRYFPYIQITIIILFLIVVLIALSSAHKSLQNQVWMGLSKETAHQLGTPLSSLEAWVEILGESNAHPEAVGEMKKDLDRLKLVADRFGKIGSDPQMSEDDVMARIRDMVAYMQKRASSKVHFELITNAEEIPVNISGALFDWVMENLMRNALDSIGGKGKLKIQIKNHVHQVWIDVCDTGRGIPRGEIKKIFKPGYSTKKRGWGLGLSLSKRIIEQYHHGSLFVKNSEPGKGTIFRIILRR